MMRALILALVMVMVIPGMADSRRGKRVIVVYDYTSPSWLETVREVVDAFNAIMPKRGPRLKYRRMDHKACDDLRTMPKAIQICTAPELPQPALGYATNAVWREGRWMWSLIWLKDPTPYSPDPWIVCHEMMHALTGIPDNTDPDFAGEDSCVWGMRDGPGSFDVEWLQKVYGAHR